LIPKPFQSVVLALGILTLSGCAPEFWQAMGQAMENSSQAYAPNPGSANPSTASRERLCVKYMTQTGWSGGYSVEATVIKGSELNRATKTFNYEAFSTYVVVFWDKGEASVLKLDYFYGSISAYGVEANDQEGRKWEVSKTSLCY
jgi:hypothetical protein